MYIKSFLISFLCLVSLPGHIQGVDKTVIAQKKKYVEKALTQERKILEQDCQSIIVQINSYFSGLGAYNSSARILGIQKNITEYLTSKGTATAMAILREYEQRGWANVAR
jgi:hypothetical protein